jgi:hypothetical protein
MDLICPSTLAEAECKPRCPVGCTALSAASDATAATNAGQSNAAAWLSGPSHAAQAYLRQQATSRAAHRYGRGLVYGVFLSPVLLVVIAVVALVVDILYTGRRFIDISDDNVVKVLQFVLVCIGGGAAGATVSALLRLRSEHINYLSAATRAALLRIMLGWLFAAALFFLMKGGIVTLFNEPGDPTIKWFFWGAVGFLAGFNERWVPDLATRNDGATTTGARAATTTTREAP